EAPEWAFYRLPFPLLLGALTFRVPVLLSFIALLMLLTGGVVFGEPGVFGAVVPLVLGLLRYFWGPLARYTDFYASTSSDGLRLRYGMFQRRMQTVPPRTGTGGTPGRTLVVACVGGGPGGGERGRFRRRAPRGL